MFALGKGAQGRSDIRKALCRKGKPFFPVFTVEGRSVGHLVVRRLCAFPIVGVGRGKIAQGGVRTCAQQQGRKALGGLDSFGDRLFQCLHDEMGIDAAEAKGIYACGMHVRLTQRHACSGTDNIQFLKIDMGIGSKIQRHGR